MNALNKLALALVTGSALLLTGTNVIASGSQSGSLSLNATVPTSCTVPTVGSVGAITYDPILTPGQQTFQPTITINCTNGAAVTFALDQGGSYSSNSRHLVGANVNTHLLAYDIYTDSGYTNEWTDVAGGNPKTDTGKGPGAGNLLTETMYIKIPASQNAYADTYSDTVNLLVTY